MEQTQSGAGELPLEDIGRVFAEAVEGDRPLLELTSLGPDELAKMLGAAIAQLQVGRVDDALKILEGLSLLVPDHYVFHQYLGLAREENRDWMGAAESYTAMLSILSTREDLQVERCEGRLLRARARALMGDLEGAAKDLAEAQGLAPDQDAQLGLMVEELARVLGGES